MYSLLLNISGLVALILIGVLIFTLRNKITSLVIWLEVLFCISFLSCIALMVYYTHYYLGESQVLQKIYFGLFWLSIILLILIIILRVLKFYKKKIQ